jgi:hypothetical protein
MESQSPSSRRDISAVLLVQIRIFDSNATYVAIATTTLPSPDP